IVVEIVVLLGDFAGALERLSVTEEGFTELPEHLPAPQRDPLDIAAQKPVEELVERIALPPAVHIGLTEAKRSLQHDSRRCGGVFDPHIPGSRPVDGDAAFREQLCEGLIEVTTFGSSASFLQPTDRFRHSRSPSKERITNPGNTSVQATRHTVPLFSSSAKLRNFVLFLDAFNKRDRGCDYCF
ncbi:conserved hypothetical protein, partial [Ricinus communis]